MQQHHTIRLTLQKRKMKKFFYLSLLLSASFFCHAGDTCSSIAAPQITSTVNYGLQEIEVNWQPLISVDRYQIRIQGISEDFEEISYATYHKKYFDDLIPGASYQVSVRARCLDGSITPISNLDTFIQDLPVFSCGDTLVDYRDGNIYSTRQVGSQCWISENLRYYKDEYGFTLGEGAYSLDSIGVLYNWSAALNIDSLYDLITFDADTLHRGNCPYGSHVPASSEWDVLMSHPGIDAYALMPGGSSGLNIELTGYRNIFGTFINNNRGAMLISTTETSDWQAATRVLLNATSIVDNDPITKSCSITLRCLLD